MSTRTPFPIIVEYSFPKNNAIKIKTSIVLVRLPRIEAMIGFTGLIVFVSTTSCELLCPTTRAGTIPESTRGTKQMIKLPIFPLYSDTSANGVNKNAVGNAGIKNVQYMKLNVAIINPIVAPAFNPNVKDAIITGIKARVATIGPMGMEPSGVKQNMNSMAARKHNFNIYFNFSFLMLPDI